MNRKLDDIMENDDFFITAYTEVNAYAQPTEGLNITEYVISKENTIDLFFFLRNNPTEILAKLENDLQSLCEKSGRVLLTAMIDIDIAIKFVEEVMLLSGGFLNKEEMEIIFFNMLNYLREAKKLGSNIVSFEGYKKLKNNDENFNNF